jgi:hypothetical protein
MPILKEFREFAVEGNAFARVREIRNELERR